MSVLPVQLWAQTSLASLSSSFQLCLLPQWSWTGGIAGLSSALPLNNRKEAGVSVFRRYFYPIAKPRCSNSPSFSSPHFPSPHPVPLYFLQHLPSSPSPSTWDESSRDEHTANNLWCLSKEVRSGLHTLGTFFLPLSLLQVCQKNILICNLWLKEWQRDRHMCTVHICFPALDLRSTVELQRESKRKAALQQMVLLKELRWNSLCYKCSLVFFETPVGSGSPAGLRSNVLRPNECIGMHTHTHTHLLCDEWSHLSSGFELLNKLNSSQG